MKSCENFHDWEVPEPGDTTLKCRKCLRARHPEEFSMWDRMDFINAIRERYTPEEVKAFSRFLYGE